MFQGQHKSRLSRIIHRWRLTGSPSTRKALRENPELRSKDAFMDLVLAEYKMRRDSGEQLRVTKFCDQFSTFRDELRALLHVENGYAKVEQQQQVMWPQPGESFLEFQLQSILGVGAASRVYLARQSTLGNRLVALKVTPFGSSEAQTLGKLRHRNVVPVLSIHEESDRRLWAVCMPYLGSATLLDVRNHAFKESRFPTSARVILEAAARGDKVGEVPTTQSPAVLQSGRYYEGIACIGAELADGLAYTHSQGVLHRDLKPSNILLTADGCAMLLDFNLAWDAQRESFRMGGTVPYMPPEQLYATFLWDEGEDLPPEDPRSDVFALGVILFELLTGRLPFPVQEADDLSETINELMRLQLLGPPAVRELAPSIPRRLARLVDQCLVVERSGRPHPEQLAEQLRRCGIRPQLRGKWSRAFTASIVGSAAVLMIAAGWGAMSLVSQQKPQVDPATTATKRLESREDILRRANEFLKVADFDDAAVEFQKAYQLRSHWMIAASQAYCLCRLDNIMQAQSILYELIQEQCSDPSIRVNYAQIQMRNNQFDIAKRYLDDVLDEDPENRQALLNLGVYNVRCPDELASPDSGVSAVFKAIELFEERPFSLFDTAAYVISCASSRHRINATERDECVQRLLKLAAEENCFHLLVEKHPYLLEYSEQPWYRVLAQSEDSNVDKTSIGALCYSLPAKESAFD